MTSTATSSPRVITSSPVVVALDYDNRDKALAFVDRIDPRDCRLKVGKEMFTLLGPQFVRDLHQRGFEVFLDLKFHDIPNTTARAVAAAAELGVWMVNVHASGGARMMTAAREALLPFGKRGAVTDCGHRIDQHGSQRFAGPWHHAFSCRSCR